MDSESQSTDSGHKEQRVYNTLSEMFIQRGYTNIENDEANDLLIGKSHKFRPELIAKIIDHSKDLNLIVSTVKAIVYRLKLMIRESSFKHELFDISDYKKAVEEFVSKKDRNYDNYKLIIKKIIKASENNVCAFCEVCPNLAAAQINRYMIKMQELGYSHGIIVCDNQTPAVSAIISEFKAQRKFISVFLTSSLLYNITKHSLVPHHEQLTDEEKIVLLGKVKIDSLPIILKEDPVCNFYDFDKNSIIRIYRKGHAKFKNGENTVVIAYRVVK